MPSRRRDRSEPFWSRRFLRCRPKAPGRCSRRDGRCRSACERSSSRPGCSMISTDAVGCCCSRTNTERVSNSEMDRCAGNGGQRLDRAGELALEAALVVDLFLELGRTEFSVVDGFEAHDPALRQALRGESQAKVVNLRCGHRMAPPPSAILYGTFICDSAPTTAPPSRSDRLLSTRYSGVEDHGHMPTPIATAAAAAIMVTKIYVAPACPSRPGALAASGRHRRLLSGYFGNHLNVGPRHRGRPGLGNAAIIARPRHSESGIRHAFLASSGPHRRSGRTYAPGGSTQEALSPAGGAYGGRDADQPSPPP